MQTILITGGLGFVGGRLVKKLSPFFHIVVSSRKESFLEKSTLYGEVQLLQHTDLLSRDTFPKKIDTVIHLAALNEWDCVQYPSEAIRVNIDETRIILENSIHSNVQNFLFFSTAHVYGSPLKGRIVETDLAVPVHPYAITHKAAEDYVVAATLQKKISGKVIRLSNSFGAPVDKNVNRWTLLANDLGRQAVEKRKLTLQSNGCQFRDFVCLTDVENVVLDFVRRDSANLRHLIYNLGSGKGMRVIDMAHAIKSVYEHLFEKQIAVETPSGAVMTTEPPLEYSIDRLREEGFIIENKFREELCSLLTFCYQNFKSN